MSYGRLLLNVRVSRPGCFLYCINGRSFRYSTLGTWADKAVMLDCVIFQSYLYQLITALESAGFRTTRTACAER